MSDEQRHCNQCGLHVEAEAGSYRECAGDDLVWVRGPALADLIAWYQHVYASRSLFGEEPMMRCAFCGGRLEAARAYHSRNAGRAVCWLCKQAEEQDASPQTPSLVHSRAHPI